MPKVKGFRTAEETFARTLKAAAIIDCGSIADMSDRAGISRSTMFRRIRTPMELSLRELKCIRRATGQTLDDFLMQIRPLL